MPGPAKSGRYAFIFEQLEPDEWLQASIAAYTGDLHPMQELLARIAEPVT